MTNANYMRRAVKLYSPNPCGRDIEGVEVECLRADGTTTWVLGMVCTTYCKVTVASQVYMVLIASHTPIQVHGLERLVEEVGCVNLQGIAQRSKVRFALMQAPVDLSCFLPPLVPVLSTANPRPRGHRYQPPAAAVRCCRPISGRRSQSPPELLYASRALCLHALQRRRALAAVRARVVPQRRAGGARRWRLCSCPRMDLRPTHSRRGDPALALECHGTGGRRWPAIDRVQ